MREYGIIIIDLSFILTRKINKKKGRQDKIMFSEALELCKKVNLKIICLKCSKNKML